MYFTLPKIPFVNIHRYERADRRRRAVNRQSDCQARTGRSRRRIALSTHRCARRACRYEGDRLGRFYVYRLLHLRRRIPPPIGIIDNSNANPATEYTGIATAYTVNTQSTVNAADTLTTIPAARFNFALSGTAASIGSISQTLENAASFNIGQNLFNDHIVLGVFKLRPSIYSTDATKLDYVLEERYEIGRAHV